MFYYAVLNENNFVVELVTSETEIVDNAYISITEEQYTSGDLLWLYYKQGQFIVCDNFIGSCDWIIYKNTDRPITPKFDEIDEQIAGKANSNHTHNTATQTADGYMGSEDKTKLDGIEASANNYTHPETHPASMITGLSTVSTSGSYNDLTDKPTIPTIPTALPADGGNADTLDGYHAAYFASGQHNHDGVYAAATHTHDYAASSHIHGEATTSSSGFMSASDKTKLNGIASGANNYTHPSSHSASMITETDSLKIMTAAERTKLAGIAENANNYTHPETHSAAIIEETSAKKVMTAEERTKLAGIESGANKTTVDSALSSTSTNPVQNKVINTALSGKASSGHTHNTFLTTTSASTYKLIYVATDGSDSNTGLSESEPMATIKGVIRKYSDKYKMIDIKLADGTYTENIGTIAVDQCSLAIRSASSDKDAVTINMTNSLESTLNEVRIYNLTLNVTVTGVRPVCVNAGNFYAYNVRMNVPTSSTSSCVNVYNGSTAFLTNCVLNSGTASNSGAAVYGNQALLIKAINCTSERTVTIGFNAYNGTDIEYTATMTATTMAKQSSYGKCIVRT